MRIVLAAAVMLAAVGSALAVVRRQELRHQEAFAERAAQVRQAATVAAELYRRAGLQGRPPGAHELAAWRQRLAAIDADAERAASRLLDRRVRDLARRWVRSQRALREARAAAAAVAAGRTLFDYCSERQRFVAQAVAGFAPPVRAAALADCFDREGASGDALRTLRLEIARQEAAAAALWDALARAAPQVAR